MYVYIYLSIYVYIWFRAQDSGLDCRARKSRRTDHRWRYIFSGASTAARHTAPQGYGSGLEFRLRVKG